MVDYPLIKKVLKFFPDKKKLKNYIKNFINRLLEMIIAALIYALIYSGLFYIADMMWSLYISTPVGGKFVQSFPEKADIIFFIFQDNLLEKSFYLFLISYLVCMAVSAVTMFFKLSQYFFYSIGLTGKIFFWAVPFSMVTSFIYTSTFDFEAWIINSVLSFFPVICLFTKCFDFSRDFLTDFSKIKSFAYEIIYGKYI